MAVLIECQIMQRDNVRVLKCARQNGLGQKLFALERTVRIGLEHFDCDGPIQSYLIGVKDNTHATFAQHAVDFVFHVGVISD